VQTRLVQSRRLLLVRHAKADDGRVDMERSLTAKGARRAAAIGAWLGESGLVPDRVVVSPARRAAETWERAAAAVTPAAAPPIVDPRIYDNTVEALLSLIRETPDDVQSVAVVGHNPSMWELATVLDDGQGGASLRQHLADGFPTGGVAVFDLATPFAAIEPGGATLSDFTMPGR
jgi:phosphohistidine phosphatase